MKVCTRPCCIKLSKAFQIPDVVRHGHQALRCLNRKHTHGNEFEARSSILSQQRVKTAWLMRHFTLCYPEVNGKIQVSKCGVPSFHNDKIGQNVSNDPCFGISENPMARLGIRTVKQIK
ncbi:hypothetical protein AVEN_186160-1 [Araneus ventricosus]|uniref:Uncharacterized protein n=1 Tax=Araneus ventricosus TaxID=182803 RepID=A0A4Y2GDF5_ARAVE|nr:hypothetical protein AVEN_186160-1 [Araneus ventricosus]